MKLIVLVLLLGLTGCAALSEFVSGTSEGEPPAQFFKVRDGFASDGTFVEEGFADEAQTQPVQHQVFPDGSERWIYIKPPPSTKFIEAVGGLTGRGALADALIYLLGTVATVAGAVKTKRIVAARLAA